MYSFNLENIVLSGGLACLIAKAITDESNKWQRRLDHVNFKNLNKLVKGNLVRGLPSNIFQNDHTCVACQKGKQHKASCKAKTVSSISQPLQLLHMDLFGPTSVRSLNLKTYYLVITDDLSRVLVTKPHNKTPYELVTGKIPIISYIRPFGCHVTILNTIDHLGKFDGKSDEGFLVGYSLQSKAFRVYNLETKRVEENLHITFLENKPNVAGKGPTWLFDLDYLTDSMNYQPVRSENQANKHAGPQEANQNAGQIKVLPPRTAEEIVAREKERKARTTLLMALPEDHLAKFHKMNDAKEMWDAIKSRFGGNDESKKMQKYILKQQFEGFSVSNTEGLHKGYDRFQSLLSQLEIHGVGVSTEDANQKFLRSLPSVWSQVSLIMRTKPGVDSLSFDDMYNKLRVFESDLKGSTASSLSSQNWQLGQINENEKFYKKTVEKLQFDAKEPVGFDKTKVECYNCHKTGHFARECRIKGTQDHRRRDAWNSGNKDGSRTRQKEDSKALVTVDGEGVDWTNHSEDEDYALMACNSSDSDTEKVEARLSHELLKNKGIVIVDVPGYYELGNKATLMNF
ncbi:ribonuclease H-like domain-containing protein [Tanacetum coccineum]